jgi:hypothetical protein
MTPDKRDLVSGVIVTRQVSQEKTERTTGRTRLMAANSVVRQGGTYARRLYRLLA